MKGKKVKLTKKEKNALAMVRNRADVFDYGIAVTLLSLEKRGLVTITKARMKQNGTERLAYFGAISKAKGGR